MKINYTGNMQTLADLFAEIEDEISAKEQ